jgi:hypothetical protein
MVFTQSCDHTIALLTLHLQVLDFRGLIASAQTQGLLLQWHKKTVHFYTEAYEQANDLLLNALC